MTNKMPDWMEEQDELVPSQPGTAGSVPSTSSLSEKPVARKASSGFTNLKKYIQANQGTQLADRITQEGQAKLNTAQSNLDQSKQTFDTGLANERAKIQGAVGEANKALNYIQTGSQPLVQDAAPTAVVKPTEVTRTWDSDYDTKKAKYDQDLAAYNKYVQDLDAYNTKANNAARDNLSSLKNYSYAGPNQLDNVDKLAQNKFDIDDYARATGSESGRGAILQTLFGKSGQYTGGARNLDNLLLGSNQSNLDKLKAIRAEATGFGQNLRQAEQQAAGQMGAARGQIDIEKAKQAQALKQTRDNIKAQLEAEAIAANTAGRADANEISKEELLKWLPDYAAYDIENLPQSNQVTLPVQPDTLQAGYQNPNASLDGPIIGTPQAQGYDPNLPLFVNLFKNKNFDERQKIDLDRTETRKIAESGGLHRDWEHKNKGRPNEQQAYVSADDLKPLFNESYTDNTWDSINADALNRRNILSEVLADNAQDGLMTAKQKQEVQMALDGQLLDKLKDTPKMAEEKYLESFFSNAPGSKDTGKVIRDYEKLGYTDPVSLQKDLGMDLFVDINKLGIPTEASTYGRIPSSSFKYNPETKKMDYSIPVKVIKDAKGNVTHTFNSANNTYDSADGFSQIREGTVLPPGSKFTSNLYQKSVAPEDLTKALLHGKGYFDSNSSPAKIAKKVQEQYLIDQLKALGLTPHIKMV